MKLHTNMQGELRECIAVIQCPYGGAIARTLTRRGSDYEAPADERDLPLATSGTISRGGAATNVRAIIREAKIDERYRRTALEALDREARDVKVIRKVASKAMDVLDTTPEEWDEMSADERMEQLRGSMNRLYDAMHSRDVVSHLSTQRLEKIPLILDSETHIAAKSDKVKGRKVLRFSRAFFATAPLDQTYYAAAQAMGALAHPTGGRNSIGWRRMMNRAQIPQDLAYTVPPHTAYEYAAHCARCKKAAARPRKKQAVCHFCFKEEDVIAFVEFKKNPTYIG